MDHKEEYEKIKYLLYECMLNMEEQDFEVACFKLGRIYQICHNNIEFIVENDKQEDF